MVSFALIGSGVQKYYELKAMNTTKVATAASTPDLSKPASERENTLRNVLDSAEYIKHYSDIDLDKNLIGTLKFANEEYRNVPFMMTVSIKGHILEEDVTLFMGEDERRKEVHFKRKVPLDHTGKPEESPFD